MAFLQSNIPYFKCWVRKEYTHNNQKYHGEFLHAMVVAVTTMPKRCLSFQVIFTGAETYDEEDQQNVHGGAMWARMPITALVGDTPFEEWPKELPVWAAQPWDCMSHTHAVYQIERASPAPWLAKVDGEFYPAKYYFTVALPNNRVRVTHPAWFETGVGAPDFRPNQRTYNSKDDVEYIHDTKRVFDNLYSED